MAAVAALAPIPVVGGASPAEAGETGTEQLSCPRSGNISNWDKCTTLSNGVLVINETARGDFVGITYWKSGGSAITARLGFLRGGPTRGGGGAP
ncbi:hypothetical protein ACGF1Z_00020 [Streptomyces sp. NPDC048018]|uniref:hypothetical protein n=1 Tax=Streptomyces sp. NPDC048018 TaxID=3365499 RepID=UPI003716025C